MKFKILLILNLFSFLSLADLPQIPPPTLKLGDALPANLFVELAKAINPSVVNISTSILPNKRFQRRQDPMLEMLQELYGFPMMPRPEMNKPQQMSLGTGFIVREDGLIVTNNHVVEGADLINVQLIGNSKVSYEAKLIGSDKRSDIALIKIEAKHKLPAVALGTSKDLQVGEWVAAFGNPYGHDHTMTKGIISSIGREISEINKNPLIQTDASINPGNSGGPLVNTKGYVVGVNSAIDARAQGIGFAIPIDQVKAILPQLEKRGKIESGYIGIAMNELDPNTAESLNIDGGVVVVNVIKGSPAYKAGVKYYDIILEFNGHAVKSPVDVGDAVSDAPIGKESKLVVLRNQKKLTLTIQVAHRPEDKHLGSHMDNDKKFKGKSVPQNLGFSVADLTDDMRSEWNLPGELEKPIVVDIIRDGIASQAGLRLGDIILSVNNEDVQTAKDVMAALKKGSNILRVARDGRILVVQIKG